MCDKATTLTGNPPYAPGGRHAEGWSAAASVADLSQHNENISNAPFKLFLPSSRLLLLLPTLSRVTSRCFPYSENVLAFWMPMYTASASVETNVEVSLLNRDVKEGSNCCATLVARTNSFPPDSPKLKT